MRRKTASMIIAAAAVAVGLIGRSPQAGSLISRMGTVQKSETSGTQTDTYSSRHTSADLSALSASKSRKTIRVNGDRPYFSSSEMSKKTFIRLSSQDSLGRCGPAEMCAYYTGIASKERGNISAVHPSGWKQAFVKRNGKRYALYNRSHLLMYKLSGLNDNSRNLITGTEYFNQTLMLSVESEVLSYVRSSMEHVMYRVTPVYRGNELVARGVLMEAESVESGGLKLCRYVPNIEPGVNVDYATGQASSASSSVSVS